MIEIMLASGALGLAAAAWVKASGMSSKVNDAGANARRDFIRSSRRAGRREPTKWTSVVY